MDRAFLLSALQWLLVHGSTRRTNRPHKRHIRIRREAPFRTIPERVQRPRSRWCQR